MKKATDSPYPDNQHTLLIQSVRFSDYTHQEMHQQDPPASVIDIQPPDRLYTVSHLVSRGFTGEMARICIWVIMNFCCFWREMPVSP